MEELSTPPEEKLLRGPTFWEKYRKYLWLVLLLLFILILTGVYIATRNSVKSQLPSQLLIPTQSIPTSSPTPTKNLYREPTGSASATSWRTYTDPIYNFSFKYPSLFLVKEFVPGTPDLGWDTDFIKKSQPFLIADKTVFFTSEEEEKKARTFNTNIKTNVGIYVQIYKGQKAQTVEEFANRYLNEYIGLFGYSEETKPRASQTKIINGIKILVVTTTIGYEGSESGGSSSTYYFYMDKNLSIAIIPHSFGEEYIQQILSTFQFIN